MPRVCTICDHPQREDIDRAAIAGVSNRAIALRFHVGAMAVVRHKADHLLPELVKARQAEEVTQATDLVAMVVEREAKAMALLNKADAMGDYRAAAPLLRVSLTALELLARLRHELDERAQVNVLLAPEWISIRVALMSALQPFPQARMAVSAALGALETDQGAHHVNRLTSG